MSDDLRRQVQNKGLPPQRPGFNRGLPPLASGGGVRNLRRDYTPVSWDQYFTQRTIVTVANDKFRVYECGTAGPVCFFLHGGGFSGLSWAVLSKSLSNLVECRCAAMDCRGHGETTTTDDSLLSADVLSNDVGNMIKELYGADPPPIILIGHSMGGAIAVHSVVKNLVPSVVALIVIDVVEGTALDALAGMQTFLHGRPSSFGSLEQAIEYCVRSGQIKNINSARVSVSGQVKRCALTANSAVQELKEKSSNLVHPDVLQEEEEEGGASSPPHTPQQLASPPPAAAATTNASHSPRAGLISADQSNPSLFKQPVPPMQGEDSFTWRIDLTKTDKYWKGWFEGMSKMFLSCNVPKMLLLAGVDRLDKELTVGQMQGKFQMQVLSNCGHTVHEDSPEKVADVVASFIVRNRLAEATQNFQRMMPGC